MGITYEWLRSGGIQWPCNEEHPDGTERLYTEGVFNTDPAYCETYGQDMLTGAEFASDEYRAKEPRGRAFLHAVPYQPAPEVPSDDFPLLLTTGRTVYQFHTRTKTGRAPQLAHAAPDVWVEVNPSDAERLGVGEGDLLRIESPRGVVQARARVCGLRPGVVFLPFHYGYWDSAGSASGDGHTRAANELTITAWDPVSKQPIFKVAAVRLVKEADSGGRPSPAPTVGGPAPLDGSGIPATVGGPPAEASSREE
jgi:anaerobic selenocysteine-containing dehydrogenase